LSAACAALLRSNLLRRTFFPMPHQKLLAANLRDVICDEFFSENLQADGHQRGHTLNGLLTNRLAFLNKRGGRGRHRRVRRPSGGALDLCLLPSLPVGREKRAFQRKQPFLYGPVRCGADWSLIGRWHRQDMTVTRRVHWVFRPSSLQHGFRPLRMPARVFLDPA
jgi:hypothetical protein